MGVRKDENSLDTCKEKIEIKHYCPDDLSKVYSLDSFKNRSFQIVELTTSRKMNIQVQAYVDFWGGYAEHGRNVCFRLQDGGQCNVKLRPIKSLIDVDPVILQRCNHLINNPAFKMDKSILLTIAGPGWAQEKFQSKNRYNVIWTMIESRQANPRIKEWLKGVTEVWSPTIFDFGRMSTLGIESRIMHLGYDHELFHPNIIGCDQRLINLRGRYVFGVLGSWNKRKGIKKIIRAFCKAFRSKHNVSLLLISKYATRPYDGIKDGEEVRKDDLTKWDIKYEFDRYTKEFNDLPHICLIDIPIHENVLPGLMCNMSCLVGFSMGESTWLPGLQAMGMKIPVIQLQSDCSGFMEYMNDNNSYLCKKVKHVVADDELVKGTSEYYEGQEFADGDEDELAEMMTRVLNEYEKGKQGNKIVEAYKLVSNCWTWDVAIEAVTKRLREINDGSFSPKEA